MYAGSLFYHDLVFYIDRVSMYRISLYHIERARSEIDRGPWCSLRKTVIININFQSVLQIRASNQFIPSLDKQKNNNVTYCLIMIIIRTICRMYLKERNIEGQKSSSLLILNLKASIKTMVSVSTKKQYSVNSLVKKLQKSMIITTKKLKSMIFHTFLKNCWDHDVRIRLTKRSKVLIVELIVEL